MKTLQGLVKEANNLQKLLTNYSIELHEYAVSLNDKKTCVDIDKLMMMATHYKIEHHILHRGIADYVVSAYLELLLSVAQTNTSIGKNEYHPVLYVCRIAAALSQAPDMKELLQNCVMLDEKKISEYVLMIKSNALENMFILDSLIMMYIYDKGNEGKLEYIADLAALFPIKTETLKDILDLTKQILQHSSAIKIVTKYLQMKPVLPYLKNFSVDSISISSLDVYVRWYATPTNFIDELPINLENKNLVYIYNAYIDGLKYYPNDGKKLPLPRPFTLQNIARVHIEKISFSNILFDTTYVYNDDDRNFILKLTNIRDFVIEQCKFYNIQGKDGNSGGNINKYLGLICYYKNVLKSRFVSCLFKDCYYLGYNGNSGFNKISGDRLVYGDNNSIKHIIDERCEFENSCTFPRK